MKHLTLLLLIGLIFLGNIQAQLITPENAAKAGGNFLNGHTGMHFQKSGTDRLNLAFTATSVPTDTREQAGDTPCYYAFNVQGGGFVLVSATENVRPILAYSDKGRFDTADLPDNMRAYLKGLQAQIADAIQYRIPADAGVKAQWERLENTAAAAAYNENVSSVEPLTENILWDQGTYFNDSCPKDPKGYYGGRCPTGCTATAMGIVLRYWKYPTHGYGSHSYNTTKYGTLSADFEKTYYNYNNMPEYFGVIVKGYQRAAVSQLLYHCGVSVNMSYSASSSGAYVYTTWGTNDALHAFQNYFGYAHAMGAQKKDYSNAQWIALLKKELQNSRPVICSGYPVSGAGHAFVCDGYDANDLFHFNWGWSGKYNCYCAVDRLIPDGYGIGGEGGDFSYSQSIVYNISPYLEETDKGWISSKAFNSVSPQQYLLNLQPDTSLHIYGENGSSTAAHVHSIGTMLNPTAAVFGSRNTQQLFRYPYRLDSLRIRCSYLFGSLHDSTDAPDTLYVYLAYYQENDDNCRISTVDGRKFLCPEILTGPIRPRTENAVCIPYVLGAKDAGRSTLTLPMNHAGATALGFDVPEDAFLQVMLRFVPGYTYSDGDTLAFESEGKTTALRNSFTLRCWESQKMSEISANGYNTALMEDSGLRYQTHGDSSDLYYQPSAGLLPQWEYHIRCNTRPTAAYVEKDTAVCGDTKWKQLWITRDGDYRQILKAADGRDSVMVLHAAYDRPIGEMGDIQGIKKIQKKGSFDFEIAPVKDAAFYRWTLDSRQWRLDDPDSLKCTLVVPARGKGVLTANAYSARGACHRSRSLRFIYCDSLKSIPGIQGRNTFNGPSYALFSMDSLFEASYHWYLSKHSSWKINGDSNQRWVLIDISGSGFDSLHVDVCDECGNVTTRSIGIACTVSIPQTDDAWQTRIWPNPTQDEIHIVYKENMGNCTYRLTDACGRLILQGECSGNSLDLSLRGCAPGMYFLQLRNAAEQYSVYKVVRQ